jgi:hypothetical protein
MRTTSLVSSSGASATHATKRSMTSRAASAGYSMLPP